MISLAAALQVLQDDYAEHGEHCDCRPCQALEELGRKLGHLSCTGCGGDLPQPGPVGTGECGECWSKANMATRV